MNILYVIALVLFCIGTLCVFWQKDILKSDIEKIWIANSGFVVSIVALAVIYFIKR